MVLVMATLLAGCGVHNRPSTALDDPCPIVTDQILRRLAPGAARTPSDSMGAISGTKSCEVDLESGSSSMRGDLLVAVSVDGTNTFDARWRRNRCRDIRARGSSQGAGDWACMVVKPWAGSEARVEGWAWLGDDYEVHVAYQLVAPRRLPASAAEDLRQMLRTAVAGLPPQRP